MIYILLYAALTLLVLVFCFLGFRVLSVIKPVKTGEIGKGLFALNGGIVNFFLYKADSGYIAVDSGVKSNDVIRGLSRLGISPESVHTVLLTHSDYDHAGGLSAFTNAKVYLPALEVQMIDGTTPRKIFGKDRYNSFNHRVYSILEAGIILEIDGQTILPVSVPGHTPGSTAYIFNNCVACTGDMCIVRKNTLAVSPKIFNNDHKLDARTITEFVTKFPDLEIVATAHGGILWGNK